jgi:hypothetical protein
MDRSAKKNSPHVVHVADGPGGVAAHVPLAASAAGDLSAFFDGLGPVVPRGTRTGGFS